VRLAPIFSLVVITSACQGSFHSVFPDGLAPMDMENQASPPADMSESLNVVNGSTSMYVWSDAAGYVNAPIEKVWAALHSHDACVDRRNVDKYTVDMDGIEPGYAYSFVVHNEVDSVVTVMFDNTFRSDVVEGTEDAPDLVAGRWQKTDGTSFIKLLAGSFSARRVDDQTTEVEFEEHLDALMEGDEPGSYLKDFFANVVALAHDQPLPTF
jgi:hypothetical protein